MLKNILPKRNNFLLVILSFLAVGLLFFVGLNLIVVSKYSSRVFSPSNTYYVQIAEENGPATTADYTVITVVDANSLLNNLGFFSVWKGTRKSVFAFKGSLSSVKTSWVDDHVLKITYKDCRQIYGQDNSWKDIKITYDGKCSTNN